jgi:hypothetical protein
VLACAKIFHGFGGYRVEAAGWVIVGAVGQVTRTTGGTWSGSINSTVIMSLLGVMGRWTGWLTRSRICAPQVMDPQARRELQLRAGCFCFDLEIAAWCVHLCVQIAGDQR